MTTVEERLLDPAPLLGAFRFEIGDESTWLGRSAIRVHATRKPGQLSHDFSPVSDELELLVDRERGLLLQVSALAAGNEISHSQLVELAFDEPVSADMFRPPR